MMEDAVNACFSDILPAIIGGITLMLMFKSADFRVSKTQAQLRSCALIDTFQKRKLSYRAHDNLMHNI